MEKTTVSPNPFSREGIRAAALHKLGVPILIAESVGAVHVVYEQAPGQESLSNRDWERIRWVCCPASVQLQAEPVHLLLAERDDLREQLRARPALWEWELSQRKLREWRRLAFLYVVFSSVLVIRLIIVGG